MASFLSNLAGGLSSGVQGYMDMSDFMGRRNQNQQQSRLADIAYQNALQKQQDMAAQRARQESYRSDVSEMGMADPREQMDLYQEHFPMKFAEQQMKQQGRTDPFAEEKIRIRQDAEARRKVELGIKQESLGIRKEQQKRMGLKDAVQIKQFQESITFRKDKFKYDQEEDEKQREFQLNLPKEKYAFEQGNLKTQLPDYLQGNIDEKRTFTQSMMTQINSSNDSYSDIYKKIRDLQGLVPTKEDFISAKGVGEKAAVVRSQVSQIIVDYNRNVAMLGALAGQDLTILEEAIPSPSQWKLMSFGAWNKTITNIQKNIKEKYQSLMNNAGINVSGNILDNINRVAPASGTVKTSGASSAVQRLRDRKGK